MSERRGENEQQHNQQYDAFEESSSQQALALTLPSEARSRGSFEYDSEVLESPVEVMASFAQNSVRRLRGAVVRLIRERTMERQGTSVEPIQHQDIALSSTTIRLAQKLDRIPTDQECRDFAEFVRESLVTESSSLREIDLVEVIRSPVQDISPWSTEGVCKVEWVFSVVTEGL